MKIFIIGIIVCMTACSAATPELEKKEKIIADFAEQLEHILRHDDVAAYQHMWARADDEFADFDGRPAKVKIPVKEEALQKPEEIKVQFEKIRKQLSTSLGGKLDGLEVLSTEYLIESGPQARISGIFSFEVTLKIRIGHQSCRVVQRSCAMTKRGVGIGDYLSILSDDAKSSGQ